MAIVTKAELEKTDVTILTVVVVRALSGGVSVLGVALLMLLSGRHRGVVALLGSGKVVLLLSDMGTVRMRHTRGSGDHTRALIGSGMIITLSGVEEARRVLDIALAEESRVDESGRGMARSHAERTRVHVGHTTIRRCILAERKTWLHTIRGGGRRSGHWTRHSHGVVRSRLQRDTDSTRGRSALDHSSRGVAHDVLLQVAVSRGSTTHLDH